MAEKTYPPLSSLNLRSVGQTIARLDHFFQARVRNRFGRLVRHLEKFIPAGGVVLDVGANHGKFSKNFAKLHGGSCRVYCFEPLEYNYTLLQKVLRPYPNAKILRIALSDKAGEAELYVPVKRSKRISPGSAHLGNERSDADFGTSTAREVYRQTIATDTLDAVVAREGIDRLDFMKIDVEGAEVLVLRGGREALAAHRPAIFCELCAGRPECLGFTVDDTIDLLSGAGYRMHALDERTGEVVPMQGYVPRIRDYLFLP